MTAPPTEPGLVAAVDCPLVTESIHLSGHLVVTVVAGTWRRSLPGAEMGRTEIAEGQELGVVETAHRSTPLPSPVAGTLMAYLARDGERVRPWQPVAWIHAPT